MPSPGASGSTLVVGGDGRYYSEEVDLFISLWTKSLLNTCTLVHAFSAVHPEDHSSCCRQRYVCWILICSHLYILTLCCDQVSPS